MGFFNLFSKKPGKPYKDEGFNKIYNLLFCDNIDLYKSDTQNNSYPWDTLLSGNPDIQQLKTITSDHTLESRQRLLAYNQLAAKGEQANQKELLGVIVEVGLQKGLDVLAAFSDGTARYINHSEKILVWETQTDQSNQFIQQLFTDSTNVVNQIGKWDKERLPFPAKGIVRLTFLVSDGLYFGEGPFEVLQADPLGGPVIHSATQLMAYLTQQTT